MIDRTSPVNIYVPAVGSYLDGILIAGSGIVGKPDEPNGTDSILVYYEGNKYGASNIVTWADRVHHAADRMLWKGRGYPTSAMMGAERDDVLFVGQFWHPELRIEVSDSEKVGAWLGLDYLPESELRFTR